MKYILLFSLLFCSDLLHAQETVKRTKQLGAGVFEEFSVLKTDKSIREGVYMAHLGKNIVASGNYQNGKRVGIWNFYNAKGKKVQTYNYDENKLVFVDTDDMKTVKYFVENAQNTDTLSMPLKIGGYDYSILPNINRRDFLRNIIRDNNGQMSTEIAITHIFTISETGAVLLHRATVNIGGQDEMFRLNDKELDDEFTRFLPAMVNHTPVSCQVNISTIIPVTQEVRIVTEKLIAVPAPHH